MRVDATAITPPRLRLPMDEWSATRKLSFPGTRTNSRLTGDVALTGGMASKEAGGSRSPGAH